MDKNTLSQYTLRLGDNSLIMGQRLSEWCGHGPYLEEDIALTNLALDYIGQTQLLYNYGAELRAKGESHDDLAYMRDVQDFRNFLLIELPNGDFSMTIGKIFFFSAFMCIYYRELAKSEDQRLSEIADKSLKEMKYHLEHSRNWVLRLGDGTDESREKMQYTLDVLWDFTHEMFEDDKLDEDFSSIGIVPLPSTLKSEWMENVLPVLKEAKLAVPQNTFPQKGGKSGIHSEHLGHLLAEMQFLQRAYPGNEW